MPQLIVNADDFGICEGTNRAIVHAFDEGIVTSTSLMVTMPACNHALELWRAVQALSVGLHVCLTSGSPILPPEQLPLLVNERGQFCRTLFGLWRLTSGSQAKLAREQVSAELLAQWERAKELGLTISHVDSHQHVHMLPGLFPLFRQLAEQEEVPLRVSQEPWQVASSSWSLAGAKSFVVGWARRALLAHWSQLATRQPFGLRRSDQCLGIFHSGLLDRKILRSLLKSLPTGTTELIVHPGELLMPSSEPLSGDLSHEDMQFLRVRERWNELQALTEPDLPPYLHQQRIQLLRPGTIQLHQAAA